MYIGEIVDIIGNRNKKFCYFCGERETSETVNPPHYTWKCGFSARYRALDDLYIITTLCNNTKQTKKLTKRFMD